MRTLAQFGCALSLLAAGAAHAQSEIILDNGSANFSTVGTWPTSTSTAGYYGTNYQTHAANGVPPAAIAVDNSDSGFSVTGTWPLSTSVSGYYGSNYQVHEPNSVPPTAIAADNSTGTAVGTWPTSNSVGGYYGTNYATHAAGTGTNGFTWTLNVVTAGTYEVYARWTAYPNRATNAKYTVAHSGGSDLVTVNQQANTATWQLLGTYTFDAGSATITLSDDANGYVIADAVMLQPPGAAPNTATWTMNVPSAGTYNVYARWTAYPNRASHAKFTINAASGSNTVTVDQQDGAGGQWNLLGTYSFNAGAATVSLTDQANGYVIADAVMLLPPGSPPNGATWTPNVPQAGTYQVYAWWTAGSNRATNATYTVTNAQGSAAVPVNQQASGGTWNLLGTFTLAPGSTDTITLTDQANGYVIADAIRLVPVQVQAQTKLYFIEVDHLNTPRIVADATGTTVWRWDQQEPFGADTPNGDPGHTGTTFDLPLRLPGQYADKETNVNYNYFRDYDPVIGRYAQSDSIGLRGGLNTYAYVGASPLIYADPLGLFCLSTNAISLISSTAGGATTGFIATGNVGGALVGGALGLAGQAAANQLAIANGPAGRSAIGLVAGFAAAGAGRAGVVGGIAGAIGGFAYTQTPGEFRNTTAGGIGGLLGTFAGQILVPNRPYSWTGAPLFGALKGGLAGIAGGFVQDAAEALLKPYACKNEDDCARKN